MNYVGMQACIVAPHTTSSLDSVSCLEKIAGQELIMYQTRLLESLGIPITCIYNGQDQSFVQVIAKHAQKVTCIVQQKEQNFYDVVQAFADASDNQTILFINGNMPFITAELVEQLYTEHKKSHAVVSFVIAEHEDLARARYNRVIKTEHNLVNITKASEYVHNKKQPYFIDAGIYILDRVWLQKILQEPNVLEKDSVTFFFHAIKKTITSKQIVTTVMAAYKTVFKIDTVYDLLNAESMKRLQLVAHWMKQGVRFISSQQVQIDVHVSIGAGSSIGAGVHLLGSTIIGAQCHIHAFSLLDHTTVGDHGTIYSHTIIKKSILGCNIKVGPFAHVQEHTTLGDHAVIGNFVETKRTVIGAHTKAKHLSYLGDAQVGNHVNIGAGVITCNHDGFSKHTTVIEDHAYVGTHTTLIAPVTIEHDAFTAAGSVVSKQVPAYALAVARSRQINKLGYVHILREKKQKTVVQPPQPLEQESISGFMGAVKSEPDTTPRDPL